MNKLITITILLLTIPISGCHEVELLKEHVSPNPTFDVEFKDTYQNVTLLKSHTYNMASRASVNVTNPYPTTVAVYFFMCNRWHRLAVVECGTATQTIEFDAPKGQEDFLIVSDGKAFRSQNGSNVDLSAPGEAVPEGVTNAKPLGWIVAMECTTTKNDFDFNDVVLRMVPLPDGSLSISSMACGISTNVWLHYTDRIDDYVISPFAENGYADHVEILLSDTAYEYEFHTWFSDEKNLVRSGYGVNVLSGYNNRPPKEVILPKEFFRVEGTPSMCNLSYCEQVTTDESTTYLKPKLGFYVTTQQYDELYMSDEEKATMIYGAWPPGHSPVMLVFPDINEIDTPEHHTGWQWPTEASRIDKVYPEFYKWLTDPNEPWYRYTPSGWTDRTGIKDDNGNLIYYGYYTRP